MVNLYNLGLSRVPDQIGDELELTGGTVQPLPQQEVEVSSAFAQDELEFATKIKERGGTKEDFIRLLPDYRAERDGVSIKDKEDISGEAFPDEGPLFGPDISFGKVGEVLSEGGRKFRFDSKVDDNIVESGLKFIANLPGNTVQLAGDLITLASDSVGTFTSVKDLARAGIETALNKAFREEGEEIFTSEETRQISESVGEELSKLGDKGRIQELLVENPADVLLTFMGGLSAAKNFAKSKNLTNLANKLDKAQDLVNPIKLQAEAIKAIAKAPKATIDATAAGIRAVTPKNLAKSIAGIDEATAKVLKNTSKSELDDILRITQEGLEDFEKPSAFAKAGETATKVVDDLIVKKNLAGKAKSDALKKVANKTINTKPVVDKFDDLLADRFNLRVAEDGTLVAVRGKIPKSADELKKFSDSLQELRTAPQGKINLENLDALVDNLQDSLNRAKLERPGAKLTTAEKTVNGFIEGTINKTLKDAAGSKFVQANEDFRRTANLVTELEASLGREGQRAAGLFKSLFSPQTGERTRQLFLEAKQLTGVDLIKEAALSKFAMEALGDIRSINLLQAIPEIKAGLVSPDLIKRALRPLFPPEKVARGLTGLDRARPAKSAEVIKLTKKISESPKVNIGFHGTNAQFDQFLDGMIGKGATAKFGRGVYLSSSPEVAKTYADLLSGLKGGKARLLEVAIPDEFDIKAFDGPISGLKKASDEARAAGFKGIKYNTQDDFIKIPGRKVKTEGHSNFIIFNPSDAKIIKNNVINELGAVKGLGLLRDLLAGSIVGLSAIEGGMLLKEFFEKSKKDEGLMETFAPRG